MSKYTYDDPVEITLGICEKCENYVTFIRLVIPDDRRVYQCMTCKAKHTQHINGKVTFNYVDEIYKLKRN